MAKNSHQFVAVIAMLTVYGCLTSSVANAQSLKKGNNAAPTKNTNTIVLDGPDEPDFPAPSITFEAGEIRVEATQQDDIISVSQDGKVVYVYVRRLSDGSTVLSREFYQHVTSVLVLA